MFKSTMPMNNNDWRGMHDNGMSICAGHFDEDIA